MREKLERVKNQQVVEAEAAALTAEQAEQARLEQEEGAFLATRKAFSALDETSTQVLERRAAVRTASEQRRAALGELRGVIDEFAKADPNAEVPTVKVAIEDADPGEEELGYLRAKEGVTDATGALRENKAILETLGVDSNGLTDEELKERVGEAKQQATQEMRAFLIRNPNSTLPEAELERQKQLRGINSERNALIQESGNLDANRSFSTQERYSRRETAIEEITQKIASSERWIGQSRQQLARLEEFADLFENKGVMADPEVARTYASLTASNEELEALRSEQRAIQQRKTSMLVGYTQGRKESDLATKNAEIIKAAEKKTMLSAEYHGATKRYEERREDFNNLYAPGKGESIDAVRDRLMGIIAHEEENIARYRAQLQEVDPYFDRKAEIDARIGDLDRHAQALKEAYRQ